MRIWLTGFWQRMERASGSKSDGVFAAVLSTHPVNSQRIESIMGWLPQAQEKYKASGCGSLSTFMNQGR